MCFGCKIAENIENSGAKGLLTALTCFFSRKQMHVHTREAIRRKALIPICNCFSISTSLFTGPKSGCTLSPVSSSLRAFFSFSLGACGVTQAQARRGKQTTLTSKLITKHERSRAFREPHFAQFHYILRVHSNIMHKLLETAAKIDQNLQSSHANHTAAAIFGSSTQFSIAPSPPRMVLSKNKIFLRCFFCVFTNLKSFNFSTPITVNKNFSAKVFF